MGVVFNIDWNKLTEALINNKALEIFFSSNAEISGSLIITKKSVWISMFFSHLEGSIKFTNLVLDMFIDKKEVSFSPTDDNTFFVSHNMMSETFIFKGLNHHKFQVDDKTISDTVSFIWHLYTTIIEHSQTKPQHSIETVPDD
jgi:hypothetical protein